MKDGFEERNRELIRRMGDDPHVREASRQWIEAVLGYEYHYHFSWLGLPIIQFPSDIVVMQELIWRVRPDLIVETGIARGGSLVFYASMLELIGGDGRVVGVDMDIREHNRRAIEAHPLSRRITMIEGSSVSAHVVRRVRRLAEGRKRVMVMLDSNHTHDHVLQELRFYSPLVTPGSYLVVFDTIIEDLPDEFHRNRPWSGTANPRTAVREFLRATDAFVVDEELPCKGLVTVSPGGFLRRV